MIIILVIFLPQAATDKIHAAPKWGYSPEIYVRRQSLIGQNCQSLSVQLSTGISTTGRSRFLFCIYGVLRT